VTNDQMRGSQFSSFKYGGEEGIRTPDTLSGMPVFKTGAINHSATSPGITVLLQFRRRMTGWLSKAKSP
jgi:hypothetical protein